MHVHHLTNKKKKTHLHSIEKENTNELSVHQTNPAARSAAYVNPWKGKEESMSMHVLINKNSSHQNQPWIKFVSI